MLSMLHTAWCCCSVLLLYQVTMQTFVCVCLCVCVCVLQWQIRAAIRMEAVCTCACRTVAEPTVTVRLDSSWPRMARPAKVTPPRPFPAGGRLVWWLFHPEPGPGSLGSPPVGIPPQCPTLPCPLGNSTGPLIVTVSHSFTETSICRRAVSSLETMCSGQNDVCG